MPFPNANSHQPVEHGIFRLSINDPLTKFTFLFDTGADISALPQSTQFKNMGLTSNKDSDINATPEKIINVKKKLKRSCNYKSEWESEFTWVRKDTNLEKAFCKSCLKLFSISHGGKNDLKKHKKSMEHINKLKSAKQSKVLTNFFPTEFTPQYDKKIATEIALTYHTVKHGQSFNSFSCLNQMHPIIFPDSEIAAKMSLGKTKASAIARNVLAPASIESTLKDLSGIDGYRVILYTSSRKAMEV